MQHSFPPLSLSVSIRRLFTATFDNIAKYLNNNKWTTSLNNGWLQIIIIIIESHQICICNSHEASKGVKRVRKVRECRGVYDSMFVCSICSFSRWFDAIRHMDAKLMEWNSIYCVDIEIRAYQMNLLDVCAFCCSVHRYMVIFGP